MTGEELTHWLNLCDSRPGTKRRKAADIAAITPAKPCLWRLIKSIAQGVWATFK